MKNTTLNLSTKERATLRSSSIKKATLLEFSIDQLAEGLDVSRERARELYALADFQQINSIGIKFAQDLIFLGYYSVEQLKGKTGADLTDTYEQKKGFTTDPCVEDQFRLVVHFAEHKDSSKRWWDFTAERKRYRSKHGYPKDRPSKKWTEFL